MNIESETIPVRRSMVGAAWLAQLFGIPFRYVEAKSKALPCQATSTFCTSIEGQIWLDGRKNKNKHTNEC